MLDIDPKKFNRPTIIDNKWMPLKPGTQLVFAGTTVDDNGKRKPHRIVITVTDLVKKINGINVAVVWERDIADGKLEESELIFFAQDDDGNVWHLGQYRELYEGIDLVGGQAWMVGHLNGAKAGIMMKADPETGHAELLAGLCTTTVQLDRSWPGVQDGPEGQGSCRHL